MRRGVAFMLVLAAASGVAAAARAEEGSSGVAAAIAARLTADPAPPLDGIPLDVALLRAVYAPRAHAPLWPSGRAAAAAAALRDAPSHGLDATAYHVGAIERRLGAGDDEVAAERDLLLSDAVMRFAVDLHAGAVVPRRWSSEVALDARPADPVALLLATSLAADPAAYLATLAPRAPAYQRLREALARYREIARRGGWPAIPDGPSLAPGASDAAVALVRRRLHATGELPADTPLGSTSYDPALVAAVKTFQADNGLTADGVIGRGTRVALGVSAEARIAQMVANLERWRWMPDDLGAKHVRVNVPGYWLEVIEDGNTALAMPVVVGRPDRRTPMFSSRITQLVFNPSWTIPQKLAREDMLPRARRNPGYFAAKGIQVYSGWSAGAAAVDSTGVDWGTVGSGIAGLKLRQPPGPGNPLGRVKFQIPNGYDVYLHDTNAKGLMSRPQRAQSSGCVRLGDALGLAGRLLADWTPERRAALTRSWQTRTVTLEEPVPVHLVYETVWMDAEGRVHFREDIYGRDAALVKAIEAAARRGRVMAET